MNKQHVFNLLTLVLALGGMESSQAAPVWVYKAMTECSDAADVEQLPAQQLQQEKNSLEQLGIPVISVETNLRHSAGAPSDDDGPCKVVDRVLKCYLIDASYLDRARRAGFTESVGRWKDCGRAPQKRRVH